MALVALRFAAEQMVAASGGGGGECTGGWLRCVDRQLIEVQRRQLGCDLILVRVDTDMAEAVRGRDRKLIGVVEPRVEERAFAVHLQVRDERVPVRDRSPAGPCMQLDAGKTQ